MSNDFEGVVSEASKDIWNIVIDLLDKKVDFDTILRILEVKRSDLKELQHAMYGDAERIAIKLAIDAHELNLTAGIIEEKTGVDRSEFIKYMIEEGNSHNKVGENCYAGDKRNKPVTARKITRFPNDYESELSKENKQIVELLRQHKQQE